MINKKVWALLFALLLIAAAESAQAFVLPNTAPQSVTAGSASDVGQVYGAQDARPAFDRPSAYSYESRHLDYSRTPRFIDASARFYSGRAYGRLQNYDAYGDSTLDPVETPEPASLILFGAGLAGVGLYRRFKK